MPDLPPGWTALLVALVGLLNTFAVAWLARRGSREHAQIRNELRNGREP